MLEVESHIEIILNVEYAKMYLRANTKYNRYTIHIDGFVLSEELD